MIILSRILIRRRWWSPSSTLKSGLRWLSAIAARRGSMFTPRPTRADIGVAPYLKLETFYFDPVKVIEYMAAGLAVIASRQGSIDRTVDHGKDGLLVPPNDVEALARAITTLAGDTALREDFGEVARQKIARNQSWDVVARRIVSLCSESMTPNDRCRCGRHAHDKPNDTCSEQDQRA